MSDIAIRVEGLGKRYRIGTSGSGAYRYRSLRDSITSVFRNPHSAIRIPQAPSTVWALRDVSCEIRAGEVVGIVGRNGAGKSTLLKILSRITEPTEGVADIYGRVGSLLEVGTGFHPELSGRENIYLNGSILGLRRRDIAGKFDEIVAFAEVEKFIDTPVKHYSSGMHVRLAFAVAAHLEPEILLVDEVLAVGDAAFQKKCLEKMGAVAGQGRTVLFISHNLAAVERLCPRSLLLEAGQVSVDGPTRAALAHYLKQDFQRQGERVWPEPAQAPGDDMVRIKAVRARDSQGNITSEFKVTDSFTVEVEFWMLQPNHPVNVGLDVYSESGTLLFCVTDFAERGSFPHSKRTGVFRRTCHVPANLLNAGGLSLNVALVTSSYLRNAYAEDAIAIRLIDNWTPAGARGQFTGEWPGGVFRPLMKWTSEYEPPVGQPQPASLSSSNNEPNPVRQP